MTMTSLGYNATANSELKLHAVSTRNIIISWIALINSIIAFILVVATTKVKRPIKITLLNLLASDIALMLNGIVYGWLVQTKIGSGNPLCVVTVFFVINGFFLSHAAVAGISFNNYMAVFYPFKHNIMVTTKSVSITIVLTWLLLCLVSGCCISVDFPSNEPCVVLSSIPRYGVIVTFCVLLILDFSVIVMNMSLCVTLRMRKQVHVNTIFSVSNRRWAHKRNSTTKVPHDCAWDRRDHVEPIEHGIGNRNPTGNENPFCSPEASTSGLLPRRRTQEYAAVESNVNKNSSIKFVYYGNKINARLDQRREDSPNLEKRGESSSGSDDKNGQSAARSDFPLLEHFARIKTEKRNKDQRFKLVETQANLSLTAIAHIRANTRRNQFRRLSVSMLIISFWCCVFNVPCSLYLFYIAFIAENRLQANFNTLGIVGSTLLVINVVGDPFIYAWRFVQWRLLIKKLKRCCCGEEYF